MLMFRRVDGKISILTLHNSCFNIDKRVTASTQSDTSVKRTSWPRVAGIWGGRGIVCRRRLALKDEMCTHGEMSDTAETSRMLFRC